MDFLLTKMNDLGHQNFSLYYSAKLIARMLFFLGHKLTAKMPQKLTKMNPLNLRPVDGGNGLG